MNTKPEPAMTGLPTRKHEQPPFKGWRLVTCQTCGTRGQANRGLLKRGQHTIPNCTECREDHE